MYCDYLICCRRVTCIYLACKVEEFNVSIIQFVANIKGDREKAVNIILNNELLLMEQLNFHLAIHNPFRPVEGLLIDIKVRKFNLTILSTINCFYKIAWLVKFL